MNLMPDTFLRRLIAISACAVGVALTGPALAGRTAVARAAAEWNAAGQPVKLEFDFGEFKAWMRRGGEWQIEGMVQHQGLLCGTYEVLLRVGHGNPGCNDVQWLSAPVAATRRKQCNNAQVRHAGGDARFEAVQHFDRITCAERVIRCTGNCK